jgi:pimeloyl-ACP methyl ester carboxylesterase
MKSSFLLFRRQFWLWLITPILISSCTVHEDELANAIRISGIVTDGQPLSDTIVTLQNTSGQTLRSTTTDDTGRFSLLVHESVDIRAGYQLIAADAELQALYAESHQSNANVTPLTTLVQALTTTIQENGSVLSKQKIAIRQLEDIGVLRSRDWSTIQPETVNWEQTRQAIQPLGAKAWSKQIATSLQQTGELAYKDMLGFPQAHGGLINVGLSEGKTAQLIKGVTYQEQIQTRSYQGDESYSFNLITPVDNLTVSPEGVIHYTPGEEAKIITHRGEMNYVDLEDKDNTINFQIQVINTQTGKGRTFSGSLEILETDILMHEDLIFSSPYDIGYNHEEAGTFNFHDKWHEVVWTVPYDSLNDPTVSEDLRILRSLDTTNKPRYTLLAAEETTNRYNRVKVTKPTDLRVPPLPPQADNNEESTDSDSDWIVRKSWNSKFAVLKDGPIRRTHRVKTGLRCPVAYDGTRANIECLWHESAQLSSLCKPDSGECQNKLPVMLIHSYSGNDTDPSFSGSDGTSNWGNLPEILQAEGYGVYEFRWRSDANFQDAAIDLAEAIRFIGQETDRKVNLIAHSFSGLLSLTYLQGMASYDQIPYRQDVQSLVTIGTPHKGMFPTARPAIDLPKGQDSDLLTNCQRITCHQVGIETLNAYMASTNRKKPPLSFHSYFGITPTSGEFITKLYQRSQILGVPVTTKNLIGLTIEKNADGESVYSDGDGIVSFASQLLTKRYNPDTQVVNDIANDIKNVTNVILGAPDNDTVPDDSTDDDPAVETYTGYRHAKYSSMQGSSDWETNITSTKHPAFVAIKDLLDSVPSQHIPPLPAITLSFIIEDTSTSTGLANATVWFKARGTHLATAISRKNGVATATMPFYPNTPYEIQVFADNYRSTTFDKYRTGDTIAESSTNDDTIYITPDEFIQAPVVFHTYNTLNAPVTYTKFKAAREGGKRPVVLDSSFIARDDQTTHIPGRYHVKTLELEKDIYGGRIPRRPEVIQPIYREVELSLNIEPGSNKEVTLVLHPELPPNVAYITHVWDKHPSVMNGHLLRYTGDEQDYHIHEILPNTKYWPEDVPKPENFDERFAVFGDDDATIMNRGGGGYGPEDVQIHTVNKDKLYRYIVVSPGLEKPPGIDHKVVIKNPGVGVILNEEIKIFPSPLAGRVHFGQTYWHVFDIINGVVVPCEDDCVSQEWPDLKKTPALADRDGLDPIAD